MAFAFNGKLQRAAYDGKLLKGAAYNGQIVYSTDAPPTGVPANAELAVLQMYSFTNTAGVIEMDSMQVPSTTVSMHDPAKRYSLDLDIHIVIKLIAGIYSLDLGTISNGVPVAVLPVTKDNTTYFLTGVHNVYIVIDGVLWATVDMNGRGKVETFTTDIPGSPQADSGDVYQKAAEVRGQISVYSGAKTTAPTANAVFKPLYDALVAKLADGTTDIITVAIYWD